MNSMNGEQIAQELGISRQAVSFTLKKAIRKLYKKMFVYNFADTPFDATLCLMEMLNVSYGDINDVIDFVNLFDEKTKKEIEDDALKLYNINS